jgi:small-conductance mechanosensitive channel
MNFSDIGQFFAPGSIGGRCFYLACAVAIAYLIQTIVVKALNKVFDSTRIPAASIFINIIKGLIWIFALLAVLQPVFGVEPTAFVAALGVTSVVISFGLQDTISNIISGLGLMLGQVIKPGDHIQVGDLVGVVLDVTWRHTQVCDVSGSVQLIPNSVLNKTAVTILSDSAVSQCTVPLSLTATGDIDHITQEIVKRGQRALGSWEAEDDKPSVLLKGSSALGIEAQAIFHIKQNKSVDQARDRVLRSLIGAPWLMNLSVEDAGAAAPSKI